MARNLVVRQVVLGLDLSLRNTGMVAVPEDWGGEWSKIARGIVGQKLPEDAPECDRIGRLVLISSAVRRFAVEQSCTTAIVEQYAMGNRGGGQRASTHLGELGGVVRVTLQEYIGLEINVVPPVTARKLLLGKVPRSDQKKHTRDALRQMGLPPDWSDDEADAFVLANYQLSGMGGFAFAVEAA